MNLRLLVRVGEFCLKIVLQTPALRHSYSGSLKSISRSFVVRTNSIVGRRRLQQYSKPVGGVGSCGV